MMAALVSTFAGLSLGGGTSRIFLRVRPITPAFGRIEMCSTARHPKLAALQEIYGSFDYVVRMAIQALILTSAISHFVA
jgi:hypothetical protein